MTQSTRRTTKRTRSTGSTTTTPAATRRAAAEAAPATGRVTRAKAAALDVGTPPETAVRAEAPVLFDREERIRMTAYFLAEQDGFRGRPESYWLQAERVVEGASG